MPTTWLPSAVTGSPEMPLARVSAMTSRIVASGRTVIGSLMTPLSCFLTRPTSRAWSAAVMFLWMMPMPAFLGDGDREAGLGDRVHRRGHERQVEADAAGQARRQVDLARQHVRVRGDEQDVVEGECFLDDAHVRHSPGRSE